VLVLGRPDDLRRDEVTVGSATTHEQIATERNADDRLQTEVDRHRLLKPVRDRLQALDALAQRLIGLVREPPILAVGHGEIAKLRFEIHAVEHERLILALLVPGVDADRMRQLVSLFRLDFADRGEIRADVAGSPVYLGLAMAADGVLKLKPQNLLLNLPLARAM